MAGYYSSIQTPVQQAPQIDTYGINQSIKGLQDLTSNIQQQQAQRAQLMLQQEAAKRADASLAIQQAAGQRAADAYKTKKKQANALRIASLDPSTSTDPIASQGTSKGSDLIALNKQIAAAYNRNPEQFNKIYGDDRNGQSKGSKYLQQLIIDAGALDDTITDPKDYMRRLTQNAINLGADPKQAVTLAVSMGALADTPATTPSKEVAKAAKAQYSVNKDLYKADQARLNKIYDVNTKGGKSFSKSFSNDPKGWTSLVESIHKKFPNTDWGPTAEGGDDLIKRVKTLADSGLYNPDDVYAAIILNSSGTNDSWPNKDRETQIKGFKKTLVKLTAARANGKGGASKAALTAR